MNAAVQVDPVLFADPPLFRVRPRPGADAVPEAVGELGQGTGGALDAAVDGALGAATAAGHVRRVGGCCHVGAGRCAGPGRRGGRRGRGVAGRYGGVCR